jgi:hypothetical protein
MTRQIPSVAAGVYQPLHQRHAYGRHCSSAPLVEEIKYDGLTANIAPRWLPRREIQMPRGGVRTLLGCPICEKWAVKLYNLDWIFPPFCSQGYACRDCAGLRYRSQYQGRRPEATFGRIQQLAIAAQGTKSERARNRRNRRCLTASALFCRRRDNHEVRRKLAYAITIAVLLTREINRDNRLWARRILPAALRGTPELRRQIADHPDTPAWARTHLLASLDHDDVEHSTSDRYTAAWSEDSTSSGLPISAELINDFRIRYHELGQPRWRSTVA